MTLRAPLTLLAAAALLAGCASARPQPVAYGYGPAYGDQGGDPGGDVVVGRAPLPFDPAPLPPNTAPGDCLDRDQAGWRRAPCGYADYAQNGYSQNGYRSGGYSYEAGSGYSATTINGARTSSGYAYGPTYDAAGYDSRNGAGYDRYGSGVGSGWGVGQGGVGYGAGYGYGAAYGAGYGQSYGASNYGSAYGQSYGYRAAGRDAYGFLTWPGKTPAW